MANPIRIEICSRLADDAINARTKAKLQAVAPGLTNVKVVRTLTIAKDLSPQQLNQVADQAHNPLTETYQVKTPTSCDGFAYAIEVGFLPGVTDNIAHTAKELISDLLKIKFTEGEAVASSTLYLLAGSFSDAEIKNISYVLHNDLIEHVAIKTCAEYKQSGGMPAVIPTVRLQATNTEITEVDLELTDNELETLGKKGIRNSDGTYRGPLALSLLELKTIREYFRKEGRPPTDIELEAIAQTWSEHCKHKIFASPLDELSGGLYRDYIKKATQEIRANKGENDFCVSVFKDNSGAIEFNENYYVTDKAETHNTPSALDPFGGAITGIVGVNRDTLGFGKGAKPVANRYGFCFADPRDFSPLYRDSAQKTKLLPPQRILEGVVKGVEAGGNESGIPGPQGFIYYNERYKGKPLVFVGTIGLIPKTIANTSSTEKSAMAGDLIVVIGGRVGQDGIHGATFSSESLDEGSPSTAVQIGDPITQKRFMDAILMEARDKGLYNSITDNGAGGISCSVAEMAKECDGCEVELDKVPLKYANLEPWKIWISESQERMTLAVPGKNWEEFRQIMDKFGVEATVIGRFNNSGRCQLNFNGKRIFDLALEFLHEGVPLPPLSSVYERPMFAEPAEEITAKAPTKSALIQLLERLNIASFANVSTRFDHEVQGSSIIKPLQGVGKVNGNATVYRPDYNSWAGVVMSQGLNPLYSDIDTYHMAACAIDTAIRNAVATGANLEHMALMDNFCWCSADEPQRLGELKAATKACYDYAVAFGTPYISGKDSMFNDFNGYDADGTPVKISVPPTLLISSLGVIQDVRKAISLDPKMAGDLVYILGTTKNELGGSEYYSMLGETGANVPQVDQERAKTLYKNFYAAAQQDLIASAISVGLGGLAVSLAKMAVAGQLGLKIDTTTIKTNSPLTLEQKLFSESQSRIIVTVNPLLKDQFEASFSGSDLSLIGEVTTKQTLYLVTQNNSSDSLEWTINDLAQAYFASNKLY